MANFFMVQRARGFAYQNLRAFKTLEQAKNWIREHSYVDTSERIQVFSWENDSYILTEVFHAKFDGKEITFTS